MVLTEASLITGASSSARNSRPLTVMLTPTLIRLQVAPCTTVSVFAALSTVAQASSWEKYTIVVTLLSASSEYVSIYEPSSKKTVILKLLEVIVSYELKGAKEAPPLSGVSVLALSVVPGAPPLALMLKRMCVGSGICTFSTG